MKLADLKQLLNGYTIETPTQEGEFWYNLAIKHSIELVNLYEKWQEPESKEGSTNENKDISNVDDGDVNGRTWESNLSRALRNMVQLADE